MTTNTKDNLINCYYCGDTKFSKQIEALLEASDKDILPIDISKTMPSDTQWHDMAKRLDTSLKSFIDIDVLNNFDEDNSYSEESLVKIINKNPKAFKGAIVIENDRIKHITRYTELLEFYDIDSAGLEKTMHTEAPITSKSTDDENFI